MEIINRQDAVKQGLKYYFTGKPCPKNHISKRTVNNSSCYKCSLEHNAALDKQNPKRRKTREQRYYEKNKEIIKARTNLWRETNRGQYNALIGKRRATKKNATPTWAELEEITEFYKACPKGMAVDHVIPLQNNLVCGLHVIGNLQYLTKEENSRKNNSFEPIFTSSNITHSLNGE